MESYDSEHVLKIFCDGGARGNPGPAASAFVILYKNKTLFEKAKLLGRQTNNYAEYSTVLLAMSWLKQNIKKLDITNINFFLDSELVVRQLMGIYKIKNLGLKKIYLKIKKHESILAINTSYTHVPREKNRRADYLINKILDENQS
jgi:ribonuclease HI